MTDVLELQLQSVGNVRSSGRKHDAIDGSGDNAFYVGRRVSAATQRSSTGHRCAHSGVTIS